MIWTTRPRSEGAGALQFFEQGEGPVMVMIHGVGLRAEAWSAMVPALTPHFRVVCVDMPGHGATNLHETSALEDYCTRLTQFLAALPIPVYLVGHSMGALLALELAARHPRKIAGVAALNAIYRRDPAAAQAVRARADALASAAQSDPEPTVQRWFGIEPQGAQRAAAEACRTWLTSAPVAGYAAAYRVFAQYDGMDDAKLGCLTCPTVFMTGAQDLNSTPEMSRAMAQLCPKGTSITLPDAAHMLPMTHADAAAAHLLDAFLDRPRAIPGQQLQ